MDPIHLAQDTVQRQDLVKNVTNLWVSKIMGHFLHYTAIHRYSLHMSSSGFPCHLSMSTN